MSGHAKDSHVVTVDGVTVRKRLNQDHPQHVAVIFEIRSDKEDRVELRLRDPVPPTYPVGFHPDFGGQHWSITGDGVELQRELDPGEQYTTVYGVGNVSETELENLTDEPTVELTVLSERAPTQGEAAESNPPEKAEPLDELQELDLGVSMDGADEFDGSELFSDDLAGGLSGTDDSEPGEDEQLSDGPVAADTRHDTGQSRTDPSEEQESAISITADRVSLRKAIDTEKFSFPAIVFTFTVTADEPIRIRVEEEVPGALSLDDIGFHHRFGDDHWDQRDHTLVFEREFDPDDEYTTLYAVRDLENVPEEVWLEEPAVTVWAPAGTEGSGERIDGAATDADSAQGRPGGEAADIFGDLPSETEPDMDSDSPITANTDDSDTDPSEALGTVGSPEAGMRANSGDEPDGLPAELFETEGQPAETAREPAPDGPRASDSSEGSAESEPTAEAIDEPGNEQALGSLAADAPAEDSAKRRSSEIDWISGTMKQTIADLETAVSRLAESSHVREATASELTEELERRRDAVNGVKESLDAVDDRSRKIAHAIDNIEENVATLQRSIPESQPSLDEDVSELEATVSELVEEVSMIKSTLASNLETSYQLQSEIEAIEAQVESAGEAAETSADQTATIAQDLTSIRTMLESNVQVLEELGATQDTMLGALDDFDDRFDSLEDRIDGIDGKLESYGELIDRVKAAMIAELSVRRASHLGDLPVAERELLREADAVPLTVLSGIGPARSRQLEQELGITTVADLANADPDTLTSTVNVPEEDARRFIETARAINSL